jgi:hypothetical protein
LVALMLGHLLRRRGCPVAVFSLGAELENAFACIERQKIRVAFISALPPSALVAARQMGRRVKARHPDLLVVVGIWSQRANLGELKERLAITQPTEVVTTLAEAVAQLETLSEHSPVEAKPPALAEATAHTNGT